MTVSLTWKNYSRFFTNSFTLNWCYFRLFGQVLQTKCTTHSSCCLKPQGLPLTKVLVIYSNQIQDQYEFCFVCLLFGFFWSSTKPKIIRAGKVLSTPEINYTKPQLLKVTDTHCNNLSLSLQCINFPWLIYYLHTFSFIFDVNKYSLFFTASWDKLTAANTLVPIP